MRAIVICGFGLVSLWLGPPRLALAQRIEAVAIEGQHAPGLPAGVVFEDFRLPTINNFGEVAFFADFDRSSPDISGDNDGSIWLAGTNGLVMLARDSDPVPGIAGDVRFDDSPASITFSDPVLSDSGDAVFRADLEGADVTFADSDSFWRGNRFGAVQLVARRSSPSANMPDFQVLAQGNPNAIGPPVSVSSTGIVGFVGNVGGDIGIWQETGGQFVSIAAEGDMAPGTGGLDFGSSGFRTPTLNGDRIAFVNELSSLTNSVWKSSSSGTPSLVAVEGMPAPGTEAGTDFDQFSRAALTSDGSVAFRSRLGGTVDSSRDMGIWASDGADSLALVIREGDPVPGFTDGRTVHTIISSSELFDEPAAAANERIAFYATDSEGGYGVWAGTFDSVAPIAYQGDHLPGLPQGSTLRLGADVTVNKHGQGIIVAREDPGVDDGIWLFGPTGDVRLVALESTPFANGTLDELSIWSEHPTESGRTTSLNEHGQVAFHARLSGGVEGIYVYTPDAKYVGGTLESWTSLTAFELGIVPATPHDVIFDPASASGTLLIGPVDDTTVRSLSVGGGAGAAELRFQDGHIASLNGVVVEANGILSGGCNIVGDVTNHGTIDLGDDLASGLIDGNLTLQSSSTLRIDLAGDAPGSEYDTLSITGTLQIGGELDVAFLSGFTPSPGDTFQIVTIDGTRSGVFSGLFEMSRVSTDGADLFISYNGGDGNDIVLLAARLGDFDESGSFDAPDIDALVAEIASAGNDIDFDMNGDGQVNHDDLTQWLAVAGAANLPSGNTYLVGDANLDGVVDGPDFVAWNDNKFTNVAAWTKGDFNADGFVNGPDFVEWNDNKFTSADGMVVPEPFMAGWIIAWALAVLLRRLRRGCSLLVLEFL